MEGKWKYDFEALAAWAEAASGKVANPKVAGILKKQSEVLRIAPEMAEALKMCAEVFDRYTLIFSSLPSERANACAARAERIRALLSRIYAQEPPR